MFKLYRTIGRTYDQGERSTLGPDRIQKNSEAVATRLSQRLRCPTEILQHTNDNWLYRDNGQWKEVLDSIASTASGHNQ